MAQFKRKNTRRGELSVRSRRKEDKGGRNGVSIFWQRRRKTSRSQHPPQACCPFKTPSVDLNHTLPGTASKSRERKPRPLPPEPGTRRHMLSMRHRLERFFHCRVSKWKKTKRSPAPSSQSRAGRAPRGAGALPLWIASAWRRVRRKARRVRRNGELEEAKERLFVFFLEEKTKRTNKVWRRWLQPAVQHPLSKNRILTFLLVWGRPPSLCAAPDDRVRQQAAFKNREKGKIAAASSLGTL